MRMFLQLCWPVLVLASYKIGAVFKEEKMIHGFESPLSDFISNWGYPIIFGAIILFYLSASYLCGSKVFPLILALPCWFLASLSVLSTGHWWKTIPLVITLAVFCVFVFKVFLLPPKKKEEKPENVKKNSLSRVRFGFRQGNWSPTG